MLRSVYRPGVFSGSLGDRPWGLQDGGDDFAEIMMPERQDLMDQWDIVSTAWQQVKGYQSNGFQVSDLTRMENSVNSLVLEMQTLLQLLAIEDVKSEVPRGAGWQRV
eukprot:Skav213858  [mRNA]  locus=scaffold2366:237771:238454:- [translate_table: standard]